MSLSCLVVVVVVVVLRVLDGMVYTTDGRTDDTTVSQSGSDGWMDGWMGVYSKATKTIRVTAVHDDSK